MFEVLGGILMILFGVSLFSLRAMRYMADLIGHHDEPVGFEKTRIPMGCMFIFLGVVFTLASQPICLVLCKK